MKMPSTPHHIFRKTGSVLALALAFVWLMWGTSALSQAQTTNAAGIEQSLTEGKAGDRKLSNLKILSAFYAARDFKPAWVSRMGSFQPKAEALLKLFSDSWRQGFNPADYNVAAIDRVMRQGGDMNRDELDMLLSEAVLRYGRDLMGRREALLAFGQAAPIGRPEADPLTLLQDVSAAANPVAKLQSYEPGGKLYQILQTELLTILQRQKAHAQTPPPSLKTILKPGDSNPLIPLVRTRLAPSVGERADKTADNAALYDESLAARVMDLQRLNNLKTDGKIGPATWAIIMKSDEERLQQILANMERLRWVDQARPDKYVLVNIPSATLWAVEDEDVVLQMPVIVGKTARPTMSFKAEITGVRFNPNWTVPSTIKKTDFLPLLQENPYALAERGIELIHLQKDGPPVPIDPGKVDWSTITPQDMNLVRMVQGPGAENPLGKVRVIMDNPYDIYLHDTNKPEYFKDSERTMSSGCIRVAEPQKLAEFLLKDKESWSTERMTKLIDSGKLVNVSTARPIPVYILYQTVWLDSEGRLVYGRDVYGQDEKLYRILSSKGDIHKFAPASLPEISL